jgi:long-chain acyl-CoA synthetase
MEKNISYAKFNHDWGIHPVPPLPNVPVYNLLRDSAKKWPDQTALICYDKKLTYREVDELTDRLAWTLATVFGVKKGDRVATMLPNCIQHSLAFFGIIKTGAIAVPCNVMYKPRELAYQLKDAEVETIIALDVFYPVIKQARKDTPLKNVIITNLKDFTSPDAAVPSLFAIEKTKIPETSDLLELLEKSKAEAPPVEIHPEEDLALLLYTAGTTGVSKGVMETHRNVWACAHPSRYILDLTENTICLQIMPMFHCSGYCLAQLPVLYLGGTVVHVSLFDPVQCLGMIEKYKVNLIFAPPTFYIGLLASPEFGRYDLSSLKLTYSCGAPQPPALRERWSSQVGCYLYDGYGLTETMCQGVSALSTPKMKKPGAVGVVFGGEIKIVDENGEIVPRGVVGEIMFRGDGVAKGYWRKPRETAEAFTEDGWLHTGDAGYLDEEGFLHFVDRYKDLIIASGYNIAPSEVEGVILQHPAVKEAAVIGVPDEYRGETVKAFVSLKDGYKGKVTAEEIIAHCRENLAAFKVPRQITFLEEIPKNAVGKILRRQLREMNDQ